MLPGFIPTAKFLASECGEDGNKTCCFECGDSSDEISISLDLTS